MRVSEKAIVLQAVRHGDKRYILKLYTRHHGLLTAIASAGRTPASKIKSSAVMPLSFLSCELIVKQNREIQMMTEATTYLQLPEISGSISKLSIAQFLNEVLLKSLKEHQGNDHLFDLIENNFRYLNDAEGDFANMHLYFLLELAGMLGFEPQNNYSVAAPYFDCREGSFNTLSLAFPLGLSRDESLLFSGFLNSSFREARFSHAERQTLLEILIAYFRLHVPGFNELKSLGVLKEVLAG